MAKKKGLYCQQPDGDAPGLVCGYPIPCPYHTIIFDTDGKRVTIPEDIGLKMKADTVKKVIKVAQSLIDSLENQDD